MSEKFTSFHPQDPESRQLIRDVSEAEEERVREEDANIDSLYIDFFHAHAQPSIDGKYYSEFDHMPDYLQKNVVNLLHITLQLKDSATLCKNIEYLLSRAAYFFGCQEVKYCNNTTMFFQFVQYLAVLRADKNKACLNQLSHIHAFLSFVPSYTNFLNSHNLISARSLSEKLGLDDVSALVSHFYSRVQCVPIFKRKDSESAKKIFLADEKADSLPDSFFDNPSNFIESLPPYLRGNIIDRIKTIHTLALLPYDATRIKRYGEYFFKRVDLAKVSYASEEIDIAEEVRTKISALMLQDEVGIQDFVGFVMDQGNFYLVSKRAVGEPLDDEAPECKRIQSVLQGVVADLEGRNIIAQARKDGMPKFTLLDFESKPQGNRI